MKKYLLFVFIIYITPQIRAQVGVGTLNPEAELHVNGSMLVGDAFQIVTLPSVTNTDEDFKLLTRLTTSTAAIQGEITKLDVDVLTIAPINAVNYTFNNLQSDNLTDVDLQYDADKYIVALSNFQYIGGAVRKQTSASTNSIGTFVMRTFISNGTWHVEIRNRYLDTLGSDTVTYKVTLIIYDKSFFKNLPAITTDLQGSNTGTASAVPDVVN
ncbi:MAG: hypothetical protein V7767_09985 [Leeuwenhoekiella sp.]